MCTSTLEGRSAPAKTTTIQDPRYETYEVVTRTATSATVSGSQATQTPSLTSPAVRGTTQTSSQSSGSPTSTSAAGQAQVVAGLGWVGIVPMVLAFL